MTDSTSQSPAGSEPDQPAALRGRELAAWRRQQREHLLQRRLHAGGPQRRIWNDAITPLLRSLLPEAAGTIFGVYWPFKAEYAIRPLIRELHKRGGCPALPCVAVPKQPLEFRRWHPGVEMVRGVYDISVPKGTAVVTPEVLVIPLVGFDAAGFRLGYGGGYYDRTIASFRHRPLLIGVGYELSRLDTIYPQPHDIPMNHVVTEAGIAALR